MNNRKHTNNSDGEENTIEEEGSGGETKSKVGKGGIEDVKWNTQNEEGLGWGTDRKKKGNEVNGERKRDREK